VDSDLQGRSSAPSAVHNDDVHLDGRLLLLLGTVALAVLFVLALVATYRG
jgi:hypothetical protein